MQTHLESKLLQRYQELHLSNMTTDFLKLSLDVQGNGLAITAPDANSATVLWDWNSLPAIF